MIMKFSDYEIVMAEIPDEISLAFNITNCPHRCENCHSPHLRENIGQEIGPNIDRIIAKYRDMITCVLFLGGDSSHKTLEYHLASIKLFYPNLKTAFYSGDEKIDRSLIPFLDYYKVGPYKEEYGPLTSKTTNQKLYKIKDRELIDITYKIQEKAKHE